MTRIAGPPYRTSAQWHGPCYVLDPDDPTRVITVIPAIPPRPRRQRVYVAVSRRVVTEATRRVVWSPPGRPWDLRFKLIPVLRQEPGWHARARELRAKGLSIRAVMRELGVKDNAGMQRVLRGG